MIGYHVQVYPRCLTKKIYVRPYEKKSQKKYICTINNFYDIDNISLTFQSFINAAQNF